MNSDDNNRQHQTAAFKARLRASSPSGRLAAHEAAVKAMRADNFDCDQFDYGRYVQYARIELDRGDVDKARDYLAQADHALTMIDYINDPDVLRGIAQRPVTK